MLLTKRPHNIQRLLLDGWRDEFPEHVWVGTTVEHQDAAEDRVPVLLNIPARTRFLSVEPMLGPVDVSTWLGYSDAWTRWVGPCGCDNQRDPWDRCDDCVNRGWVPPQCRGINLVICGGESAAGARAFDLDWARDLRDQCAERDVAFFFKQMGSNPVGLTHPVHGPILPDHRSGADMGEVPADLRVRQMPINEHPWRVPA
jgi:protein gp37